jgi:hypothetical protein
VSRLYTEAVKAIAREWQQKTMSAISHRIAPSASVLEAIGTPT